CSNSWKFPSPPISKSDDTKGLRKSELAFNDQRNVSHIVSAAILSTVGIDGNFLRNTSIHSV
ncbi:MAG: hypothetical protein ACYC4N_14825, partial [Pirellulaceae bacterium]